jgi:hypothetical protein
MAIVAGLLPFAVGWSPDWPLLAAVRPGGAAVVTVAIAAAVCAGVTTLHAVFNT